MTIRILILMIVPSLLAAASVVAVVDSEITPLVQTETSAVEPDSDARERGLTSLQEADYLAAAAEFGEAAGLGDAEAMRHLGDMAVAGLGIAQSYDRAIHWYCKAAHAGDTDSVDRLETFGLSSWSTRRDAQGWKTACDEWLNPSPPIQLQTSPASPKVNVNINVQPQRDQNTPSVSWPGNVPWHWRWVDPPHPPKKPKRPSQPLYAPGVFGR